MQARGRLAQVAAIDRELRDATSGALRADMQTSGLQLLQQVTLAAVLLCGGLMADGGAITVGTVATFALALRQLFQPLDTLGIAYGAVEGARAELARVLEVISAPGLPRAGTAGAGTPVGVPRAAGLAVELVGVSYSYDGRTPAVVDADLRIEAGEHVALVGTTGSGKSTIAKLVAGLYVPDTGTVRIGGRDARDWAHDALRGAVVLLPQDVHVVAGTVADNLRLVPGEHTDAQLLQAIERAGLTPWLAGLPRGLFTDVGDRGAGLSAGERQLLAMARVALADPAVLILDEASADIDATTERVLDDALARSAAGRTTIVVAHRPSTAGRAARRIRVEGGRITSPPTPPG